MPDRIITERSVWAPDGSTEGPVPIKVKELSDGTFAYANSDETTQALLVEVRDLLQQLVDLQSPL